MKNRMDCGLSGVEKKRVFFCFGVFFFFFFGHGNVRIVAKVIRIIQARMLKSRTKDPMEF